MATYPYAVTGTNSTTTQDPTKPKKPLPTWDNQVQSVPLTAPQQPAVSPDLNVANDQVMNTAQNKAVQGPQSATMDAVVQGTQNLLKDPSMGKDYGAEKQLQLEQQNRNMNQQMETLRQQTAPQAYTGQNLRDLTNVALQAVQQRADTGRQIDIDQNKAQREAMMQALTQGQNVAQQERGAFDQDIQNLLQTRGAMEGEKNRVATSANLDKVFLQDMEKLSTSQDWQGLENLYDRELQKETNAGNWENAKELEKMRGELDLKKLTVSQNWEGAQNEADRLLAKYTSEGDWESAYKITVLKGDIDAKAQKSAQEFAKGERIGTQGWQTDERLSSQDFEMGTKYFDRETATALQNGDFEKAKYLQERSELLQLKMQTQEFNQEEKITYINAQIADAKANGDVERQERLYKFQHTQEMETLEKTQGHDVAMAYLKNGFDTAMKEGDYVQAKELQRIEIDARASEASKDRVLEEARIALQARGIDMQQVEQRYNMINAEIEAGRAAPDAATNYLNSQLEGTGIKITAVNPEQATKEAIDADYKAQEYQFAKTHPDLVANGDLTDEGKRQFMEFVNKGVYGESTVKDLVNGISDASELQGGAEPTSENSALYSSIAAKADVWTPQVSNDGRGFWTPDVRTINNAPAKGKYFKMPDGTLMMATSDIVEEKSGQNYQYFTAIDVNTGNTIRIRANEAGDGVTF